MAEGGEGVCLVKPQFEAGKDKVGKKGVVRDPQVHLEVLEQFLIHAANAGFGVKDITFSPIKGPEGNIEYLGYLTTREVRPTPGIWPLWWSSPTTPGRRPRMKIVLSSNPYRDRGLKAAWRPSAS